MICSRFDTHTSNPSLEDLAGGGGVCLSDSQPQSALGRFMASLHPPHPLLKKASALYSPGKSLCLTQLAGVLESRQASEDETNRFCFNLMSYQDDKKKKKLCSSVENSLFCDLTILPSAPFCVFSSSLQL